MDVIEQLIIDLRSTLKQLDDDFRHNYLFLIKDTENNYELSDITIDHIRRMGNIEQSIRLLEIHLNNQN